ncbi:Protein kinase domain-containing protein [Madurella fahalii]|uniref:Protein kinase domain-containing protein n=1 Tax=Madurella fahalii TaxID=1157608 RepID=A0ABQ0GMN5_9PEZI
MASSALKVGQRLKGRLGIYTVTTQLYPITWPATDAASRTVIIKRDLSNRINTERTLLNRFQHTSLFRPLVDEIDGFAPDDSAAIVLKHYDCHIGQISKEQGLSSQEVKYVGSCILQALCALHASGYIHTDVKPGNILVNRCSEGDVRFKDVCLADLGDAVLTEGIEATNGYPVGTAVFRSPEATLMMPFTMAHDIWSFGSSVCHLDCDPS